MLSTYLKITILDSFPCKIHYADMVCIITSNRVSIRVVKFQANLQRIRYSHVLNNALHKLYNSAKISGIQNVYRHRVMNAFTDRQKTLFVFTCNLQRFITAAVLLTSEAQASSLEKTGRLADTATPRWSLAGSSAMQKTGKRPELNRLDEILSQQGLNNPYGRCRASRIYRMIFLTVCSLLFSL
jgi:hypothetical protein